MSTSGRLLVRDVVVLDGTGGPPVEADVVVTADTVSELCRPRSVPTVSFDRVLDGHGLVLTPGFVDVHSHADNGPLLAQDDLSKIRQGVTTEVVGNCGTSLAPVAQGDSATPEGSVFPDLHTGWHSTAELFEVLDRHGYVTNCCPLVGHGTLRRSVVGPAARPVTPEELTSMRTALRAGLDAGAFGLSSGLIYPPGAFADVAELAGLVAELPADRVYATHMRNESAGLLEAIEEALTTTRRSAARLEVSHLKAGGPAQWRRLVPQALERLDRARAAGQAVGQDVYPYAAASTSLSACLPPWAHDGGPEALLARLTDGAELERMRREVEGPSSRDWENILDGTGGYDGVLVSSTTSGHREGMTLAEIARAERVEPFEALVRVLAEERLGATMVEFCMCEDDVETVLAAPGTAVGSDGLPPGLGGRPHPRMFGTFPRVLGHYVRERGVLTSVEAVHRMTGLPAGWFGVPGRGRIAPGLVADLVLLDPGTVGHPGTYTQPTLPPTGIEAVVQSGHVVVDRGRWCGVRRGRRLLPA